MNRKIVADMNRKTIAVILLAINSLAVRTEAAISTSPSRAAEFDPVAFIEDALARGEKTVVLPKGRYWLVPKEGRVSYMTFAGLDGVTVDFGGSEFVGKIRTACHAPSGLQEMFAHGDDGRLRAVCGSYLRKEGRCMFLYHVEADAKLCGDVAVRESSRYGREDFRLTGRKLCRRRIVRQHAFYLR